MKSILIVAAGLFSLAPARPFTRRVQMSPPAPGTQFYRLRASSFDPAFNDQWVSPPASSSATNTYVLGSNQSAASRFFVVKYNATNTWELHAAEDADRQVVLRGRDQLGELLYVDDVLRPSVSDGELAEWGVFIMDGNVLGVKDGSALTRRSFVVVHPEVDGGAYELALYDGESSSSLPTVTSLTLSFVRVPGILNN